MNTVKETFDTQSEYRLTVFHGNKLFKALKSSKTHNSKPIVVRLVKMEYTHYNLETVKHINWLKVYFEDVTNGKQYYGWVTIVNKTCPAFKKYILSPENNKGRWIEILGAF